MFVPEKAIQASPVVLGIDPGLTRCGYAVLRRTSGGQHEAEALALGVIRTEPGEHLANRLAQVHEDITDLLAEFSPDAVVIEQVFLHHNVRTAMSVAQVSGVVLSLAALSGCAVAQYTPTQVKGAVAGWGQADKTQIQKMVKARLGLASLPQPADAADAAALALCHLAMSPALTGANARISRRVAS